MGINYVDSGIVYNRWEEDGKEYYSGTRFDDVRIELTQGADMRSKGLESTSECIMKIPNTEEVSKKYLPPMQWIRLSRDEKQKHFTFDKDNHNFFVIVKKPELSIDIELPTGIITRETYPEGFYEYVRNHFGYAYLLNTVDVFGLIPRFELSGA